MNKTLLVLFGFSIGCSGGAAWIAFVKDQPAAVATALPSLPPQLELVLVATHELSSGSVVQASDLAWQGWPRNTALKGVIRKSETPAAMDEIKNAVLRRSLVAGEPIRREKLAKGGNAGDLSAMLAPGHSAVAIAIEGGAATAAGASIVPNGSVDVLPTTREKSGLRSGSRDASVSAAGLGAPSLTIRIFGLHDRAFSPSTEPHAPSQVPRLARRFSRT